MKKQLRLCILFLGVLFVNSCTCGGGRKPIEAAVPGDSSQVAIITEFSKALSDLNEFINGLVTADSVGDLENLKASLKVRYGFDPTVSADYKKLGLDVSAGAAFFAYNQKVPEKGSAPGFAMVLPVADEKKFNEQFKYVVGQMDEPPTVSEQVIDGRIFAQLTNKYTIYYTFEGKYVYIFNKTEWAQNFTAFLKNRKGRELSDLPKFKELKKRVAPKGTFYLFHNDKAPFTNKLDGIVTGALLDFSSKKGRLDLMGQLQMGQTTAALAQRALSAGTLASGASDVPSDTMLYALATADISLLEEKLVNIISDASTDVKDNELLPYMNKLVQQFSAPYVASIHLGDIVRILPEIIKGGSINKEAIFLELFQIAVSAHIKEREAFLPLLEELSTPLSAALEKQLIKSDIDGATVYSTGDNSKVGWALKNDFFVYAAGSDYITNLMKSQFRSKEDVSAALEKHEANISQKSGLFIALRFDELVSSLNALAEGPLKEFLKPASGKKSLPAKIAEILSDLDDLAVSTTTSAYPDSLDFHLSFKQKNAN